MYPDQNTTYVKGYYQDQNAPYETVNESLLEYYGTEYVS